MPGNEDGGSKGLTPRVVDELCAVTYVEDYLDCIESLPDDLQRNVSQLREIDAQFQEVMKEIEESQERYLNESDPIVRRRKLIQIQRGLVKSQELGDEKLQLVSSMVDMVENRARQLDEDQRNLDAGKDTDNQPEIIKPEQPPERNNKRSRRQRSHEKREAQDKDIPSDNPKPVKKKKRSKAKAEKQREERESSPSELAIDPNEPRYCLCNQVSYGEMIGCDNEECEIEWFHFDCVALHNKPKGKWYCPKCRGDKATERGPGIDKKSHGHDTDEKKKRGGNR
ncbi:inhibitor of growth protein 1-like [Branchiostoma lanceolatum]|uniref:inhibitor of growth protein 1-like n=1 Tax=Branchiostoma lanceolatum TaxID=7740 RepID=UPI001132A489